MAANRSSASKGQAAGDLRIRLRKSTSGRLAKHRACVAGLGLRRIGDEVCLPDRPEIRGMVNRVRYLLDVEEIARKAPNKKPAARTTSKKKAEGRIEETQHATE